MASTAYGWKRVNIDYIPLNLDNCREASPTALRRELLQALRIDANWKSESTRVKKRVQFDHGDFIYFVHLLHDDIVFTLSRNGLTDIAYLSAWKVGPNKNSLRRLGKVEPVFRGISLLPSKISATVHTKEEKALIVALTETGTNGYLQFFTLSLRPEDWGTNAPYPALFLEDSIDVIPNGSRARVHDIQIYDSIIIASYTELSQPPANDPLYYDLIVLDIEQQHARSINVGSNEDTVGDKFVFKLLPDAVLTITSRSEDGVASVYDLKMLLESSSPANTTFSVQPETIHDTGSLRIQYRSKFFSAQYSIYLPLESISQTPTNVPSIAVNKETGEACLFQLGVPKCRISEDEQSGPILIEPQTYFQMRPAPKLDFVNLGPTGHRMIWMEILPSDGVRIMKAVFPTSGEKDTVISELLPQSRLPMKYSDCLALWLDERRGRVCLSLLNQKICILDL